MLSNHLDYKVRSWTSTKFVLVGLDSSIVKTAIQQVKLFTLSITICVDKTDQSNRDIKWELGLIYDNFTLFSWGLCGIMGGVGKL